MRAEGAEGRRNRRRRRRTVEVKEARWRTEGKNEEISLAPNPPTSVFYQHSHVRVPCV